MNTITEENRSESYSEIIKSVAHRQQQCVQGLQELGSATARELAEYLYTEGITPTDERNYTHPRLNELVQKGVVQIVGKRPDTKTHRRVSIYKLK